MRCLIFYDLFTVHFSNYWWSNLIFKIKVVPESMVCGLIFLQEFLSSDVSNDGMSTNWNMQNRFSLWCSSQNGENSRVSEACQFLLLHVIFEGSYANIEIKIIQTRSVDLNLSSFEPCDVWAIIEIFCCHL